MEADTPACATTLSHAPRVTPPVRFTQLALHDLAIGVLWQCVQELDRGWLLVRRESASAVLNELGLGHRHARAGDDQRLDRLAPLLVGHAHDGHFEHGRMHAEDFLNLTRVDIRATADDQVLFAVRNVKVAVLVQEAHVTRVVPAVAQGLRRGLGLVPVALHDQVTADHDLAVRASVQLVIVVINDPDADPCGLASG